MDKHYIRCLDEGYGPVSPVPHEEEGTTALMVNPKASQSVLMDAARARVARIVDVTTPYFDLEDQDGDLSLEDVIRLLITVCAMGEEVGRLLDAAQCHPFGPEPMRKSYRETVEAAEALVEALHAGELKPLPEGRYEAIVDAAFEMEGHISAARDDFLGAKEVQS